MTPNKHYPVIRLHMLVSLAIALTLLTSCSMNPFRADQAEAARQGRVITVTSTPSGATVRANGEKLGATPVKVNLDKSIPHKWVQAEDYGVVYRVSGKLTLEKHGCADYTIPVSHAAPADDVDVTLVCRAETPAPVVNAAEPEAPAIPETMEQRLRKLEQLHRDGVISTDEYKRHRNRILGEL